MTVSCELYYISFYSRSGESSSQEKCDVVETSAYGVTLQGTAGGRLEPDYNMENNPLYEMSKGHKT